MATCEVVFRHQCSACGRVEEQRVSCVYLPLVPELPERWREIEGRVVCDRHSISVVVDDQTWGITRHAAPEVA